MALCLVLLCSSYSNSQSLDPVTGLELISTGNVLNLGSGLPWSNTVTGAAGGFNGGNVPAYNPGTGNIIFGYMQATVSQTVAINTALANAGTGIQIGGYKYSWQINNDLYNGGGNRGTLTGNVSLTSPTGSVLESFNYNYSQTNTPSFTTFSGTQLFNNRYDTTSAGNLVVSFTGKDQNWWAGYYGPRVHVDNVSLLYTAKPVPVVVDPCTSDPLYSPTCPGYATAYIKNQLLGSIVSSASAPTSVTATTSTAPTQSSTTQSTGTTDPTNAAGPSQGTTSTPQGATSTPQGTTSTPQGVDPAQDPAVAQVDPTQPSTPGGPLTSGSPAPIGSPPQQASASSSSSGPAKSEAGPKMGASQLMSIVKTAQDKDKATQQSAVQNAAKIVEGSTQQSHATATSAIASLNDMSANSAQAAAQFSSQTTQASIQAASQTNQTQQAVQASTQSQQTTKTGLQTQQFTFTTQHQQDTQVTTVDVLKQPVPMLMDNAPQASSGTGLTINRDSLFGFNLFTSASLSIMQPTQQPATVMQFRNEVKSIEIDTPQMQVAGFSGSRAGNPLSDMMQQRFELMQNNIEQRSDTVKKDVQPNELAGGVDIASMMTLPQGFNAYSTVLKDAAFYEPREVYKGQTVVDNVRALRQMGSDSLHKAMVDSQYKKGD